MARIVCAWEFGTGLGHVRRLLPIARELRSMGHAVSVAVRDSLYIDHSAAEGFETFAAPLLREPMDANRAPINSSDILLSLGFSDAPALGGVLRAWRSLFEAMQPSVLVADYAPSALLAAGFAGIPRATVGSGFALPPPGNPIPALRPWMPNDPGVLKAVDDRLVACVHAAAGKAAREIHDAPAVFHAEAHILCTFPEIDPFGAREGVAYVGPPASDEGGLEVRWQENAPHRLLAYLKPDVPYFDSLLADLAHMDAEVIAAVPGIDPARAHAASTGRLRVYPRSVRLEELLPTASLCLSHAGSGFVARALVAGVPMALLPLQVEQYLIARRVEEAGLGALAPPHRPPPRFGEWLPRLLASEPMREAARRLAASHRGYSFALAARQAAQRVAALAAR
jgi:UDP:flavonoid glycosyltransferase YjiC (YdhE family)